MSPYKVVLVSITVPIGDFCSDGKTPCDQFSNDEGYPHCDLGFNVRDFPNGGYKKPLECLILKER